MSAAVLGQKAAAAYLNVHPRWLDDAPIPRVDMRKAGSGRPLWRWRLADLDRFLDDRRVEPGEANPLDRI